MIKIQKSKGENEKKKENTRKRNTENKTYLLRMP